MCIRDSYCFLWGQKQESTATWHGLFLSDGRPTDGVDAMHRAWTGEWPSTRSPGIVDLTLKGKGWRRDHVVQAGEVLRLEVEVENLGAEVLWTCALFPESTSTKTGGDRQASLKEVPASFEVSPGPVVEFAAPQQPGAYRVFVRACNTTDQCSSANLPLLVSAPQK